MSVRFLGVGMARERVSMYPTLALGDGRMGA